MKIKQSESSIVKACMQYLRAKQYFVMRCNTGLIKTEKGSYFKQGVKGMADVLAIKQSSNVELFYIYWIECKTISGKQSPFQRRFQEEVENRGHRYLLIHSLDELMESL